jgi:uncharacterized delta-60 repeat protein
MTASRLAAQSDSFVDLSFNPGNGPNDSVLALAIAPEAKIVIGGYFSAYDGTTRSRLARLDWTGGLDLSFFNFGFDNSVLTLAVQTNGDVVAGGRFTEVAGTARHQLVRLKAADGAVDEGFVPPPLIGHFNANNAHIDSLAIQADGKVIIGGDFAKVAGTNRKFIARLNIDGTLDTSFDPGSGITLGGFTAVTAIEVQTNQQCFIAGEFTAYDGTPRPGIARVNVNGSLDNSFNPAFRSDTTIDAFAVQSDGKVVVSGNLITTSGITLKNPQRLETNGNVDATFDIGSGADGQITHMAVTAGDKIIISGYFSSFNGTNRTSVARLNADGSLDPAFGTANSVPTPDVLVVQSDGRVLIGGNFFNVANVSRENLARLLAGPAGVFQWSTNAYSVGENAGTATLTVLRSGGSSGTVSVGYSAMSGTAAAGADFAAVTGTLRFGDGETNQTLTVPILQDSVVEGDEVFQVFLANPTGGAALGMAPAATVTIHDDDSSLQFDVGEYSGNEATGSVTVRVVREGGGVGGVSVDCVTIPGSATPGGDYAAITNTVTWLDGETGPKDAVFPLLDDTLVEPNETFTVALVHPVGGPVVGPRTNATVKIIDDDSPAVLQLAQVDYTVPEDVGTAILTVRRSGGAGAVTVDFATINLTATAGSDYVATAGTLDFAAGDAFKTIAVPILDDYPVEGDETFTVQLSHPTGASLTGATNATVTINDTAHSYVDLYGHGLKIVDNVSVYPLDPSTLFTNRLTLWNPSASSSFSGFVEVSGLDTNGFDYVTNRFSFDVIPAGGQVDVVIGSQAPVDFTPGTNYLYATAYESLETNNVPQDSRQILATFGTSPPSGGIPTGGGSLPLPGFVPPPTITNLVVTGPAYVDEGGAAAFQIVAQYDNGTSLTDVPATWTSTAFPISNLGQMTTDDLTDDLTVAVVARAMNGYSSITTTSRVTVVVPREASLEISPPSAGDVQLRLQGTTGRRFELDVATHLVPPIPWTTLSTNQILTNGVLQVVDPAAAAEPARFYRTRQLP